MLASWKKDYDQPRQHIKMKRHHFADKGPSSQIYSFSSGHVWMWVLGYKESWAVKNWCFWTVVLEKTLENPLDCKEIKPVNPKGIQSWIFIGRTNAEAEAPVVWPAHVKSWLIWKDPDVGKDWGRRRRWRRRDDMVEWYHQLDEHEFEQVLRVGWWIGKPSMMQSMRLQWVIHDWATELTEVDMEGKLENICNRIKLKREFTRICFMRLKPLNPTKYTMESWIR